MYACVHACVHVCPTCQVSQNCQETPGYLSNLLVSHMGEQISQVSNETKNIFVWPQLTKDRQSLRMLKPTTTAGVISIKFCSDWTMEAWLNSILVPCMLHCLKYALNTRSPIIAHRLLIIYLNNANQYISILYEVYLIHICLLIVTIRAHNERNF